MDKPSDIKDMWKDLNARLSVLEAENRRLMNIVKNDKLKSIRQRLISRYRKFIILALCSAFVFPGFILLNPLIIEKFRLVTAIYWCFFMLLGAGVDTYLLYNVKDMDIYNGSVSQISKIAIRNRKIHKLWIIFGLPLAFIAVLLWGFAMDADKFVILGMIIGGLAGGVIGATQLRKIMYDYKKLMSYED